MKIIYIIGIRFYALAIFLASFFNQKAKDSIKGRKNSLKTLPDLKNKEVFWFHCASLGEFDQGLPVMNLLRKKKPNVYILVTFFSPSGYNHYHKRQNPVDFACYIPFDTQKNARRFINTINPTVAIFVKYEFWSNHIFELRKNQIKTYSISTLLRPTQHYFKWYGSFFRKTLSQFDYFFVQNEQTKQLLNSINIQQVSITGDTRFDRVLENKKLSIKNKKIEQFVNQSDKIFIIGSSWAVDEDFLLNIIHSNIFDKYIIAPHNVETTHIQSLKNKLKTPTCNYSDNTIDQNAKVMIIDTIGQLTSAYAFGTVAYVGGGWTGKLHNILEPTVYGLPVIFGPKYSRFPEATNFIKEGIAFSVSNETALNETIQHILNNIEKISEKGKNVIKNNTGASEKIINYLIN